MSRTGARIHTGLLIFRVEVAQSAVASTWRGGMGHPPTRNRDERSECGKQMVTEVLSEWRLVEPSHKLQHAIEFGPTIALHVLLLPRILRRMVRYVK
jgi:hypothetical protein